jgi:RNase H-fold protein (predicted Holliday junction resolvase)
MTLLAIDPGKYKFGYAVMTAEKQVLQQGTAEVDVLCPLAKRLVADYNVQTVVIGDRTGGNSFYALLATTLASAGVEMRKISEDNSSREGRRRFLETNRQGWRRLVPLGLQSPWRPYDDYVAVVLGERFLAQHL